MKMNLQSILEFLLAESKIENACICEFSSEDITPTIHVTLWRGYDLSDILDTGLEVVCEGFNDIGRTYSLQAKN